MIARFAWRYFRAKKSANAINIIAWVTTCVIGFATCCQVLVLSVYNGFEDLVKSLYSSFYTDIKIVPATGKTIMLTAQQIAVINNNPSVAAISMIVEDKGILQNGEQQTFINLKGVDENYGKVSGLPSKIVSGKYSVGTLDNPALVVGTGVQNAADITVSPAFDAQSVIVTLPKRGVNSIDPLAALSEGHANVDATFSIQQDFDNSYAITNIAFIKQQMSFLPDEYSAAEIRLNTGTVIADAKSSLQKQLGDEVKVLTLYEQNSNLYNTIRLEKWAIYAVLTLILIVAAFNMVSALSMLVIEKQKDISILQSMGTSKWKIIKIFLAEGFLLGSIGAAAGILLATIICLLQIKFQFIKMYGGSFLIDYFPVKLLASDFLLVASSIFVITALSSWVPAFKASRQKFALK